MIRARTNHAVTLAITLTFFAWHATALQAYAEVGMPFTVVKNGFAPHVAISHGTAVLVWASSHGIKARQRTKQGVLGSVQSISAPGIGAFSPRVAVDGDGDSTIVWAIYDGAEYWVQARRLSASGVLGLILTLSSCGNVVVDDLNPQVKMKTGGEAVVVWPHFRNGDHEVRYEAREISRVGTLRPIRNLTPFRAEQAFDPGNPQLATDGGGNSVFAWNHYDGVYVRLQARTLSNDGTLSHIKTISPEGENAAGPRVSLSVEGIATFAWSGHSREDGLFQVRARSRSAAGVLGTVDLISRVGQEGVGPEIALADDGDALFVWVGHYGTDYIVEARRRTSEGLLKPVESLSATTKNGIEPTVAMARDGSALVAWTLFTNEGEGLVQFRSRLPSGGFGPTQTFPVGSLGASSPEIAMDDNDRAIAVWSEFTDPTNIIKGAASP